jgi:hypothetical protein
MFLFCSIVEIDRRQHCSIRREAYFTLRKNARTQIGAVLMLCGALTSGSSALADDYDVDYGIDTVAAGKDAGSLACRLKQTCRAKMEPLGLRIGINLAWKESGQAVVSLEDDDGSCCYFAGGGKSMTLDVRTPVSRLQFFKGSPPRGGLYIQNEPAGILYLRFKLH